MKILHVRSFWLVGACRETLPRKLASSLHDIQGLYAVKVMTEVGAIGKGLLTDSIAIGRDVQLEGNRSGKGEKRE